MPPSQHHVAPCVKGIEWEIWHEKIEKSGSVLGQHLSLFKLDCRGYKGGRHRTTPWTRCQQDTLLVTSYDTQGNGECIPPPVHRRREFFDEKYYNIFPFI